MNDLRLVALLYENQNVWQYVIQDKVKINMIKKCICGAIYTKAGMFLFSYKTIQNETTLKCKQVPFAEHHTSLSQEKESNVWTVSTHC